MKDKEYLQYMIDINRQQEAHLEFYELAEKYGFYTPWCVEEYVSPVV